jgi:hypothetical protein
VVDFSDPTNPIEVADTKRGGFGASFVGDYLFGGGNSINSHGPGFEVSDLSDQASPISVGSYHTKGSTRDITVVDDYAYIVAGYSGGVQVFDVSDVHNITPVAHFNTEWESWAIDVSDGLAYLAATDLGLQIVDTSGSTSLLSNFDRMAYGETTLTRFDHSSLELA